MNGRGHKQGKRSPNVSVIIPCFNQGCYLDEAVESVLDQTMQDFEIIVVDDGSTDEYTNKLLKDYRKPKTAVYAIANCGLSAARNYGIKHARGKYILPLDADDKIAPEFLDKCCGILDRYPQTGFVYTYVKFFGSEAGEWLTGQFDARRLLVENMVSVCSLIRKEALDAVGGYNEQMKLGYEDWDLWISLAEKGWHGYRIPEFLFFYRKREGTMSTNAYRPQNRLKLVEQICRSHPGSYTRHLAYVVAEKEKCILRLRKQLDIEQRRRTGTAGRDRNQSLGKRVRNAIPIQALRRKATASRTKRGITSRRVAYIVPGLGIGGGVAVVCQHCNRLLRRGFDVAIVNSNPVNLLELDWFPNQKAPVCSIEDIDGNYDIAVATGWTTAYNLREFPASKKFYFVQSDESRFYPPGSQLHSQARKTYNFDFNYFTEAKWIQHWLQDEFGHKVEYVPNGLDPALFHPSQPLEPKGRRVRVLLEGAIDVHFKNMESAFEAVRELDCEVWCVSSSGRPASIWRCDRFFEYVPIDRMKHIYSSCDILLKLSLVEGVFGPPLEMMACGGTCVVGKVDGYDEYIVDGYNALVVECGDIEGAKAALTHLIENRKLRMELIKGGLETATRMDWKSSIDKLEKIFDPRS